jgi:hypothetical protein
MFKLLIVFPVLVVASIVLGVGAFAFLPLLVVFPVLLGVGLAIGAVFLALRIVAFVVIGVGGLLLAGAGVIALVVAGALAVAIAAVFAHLLVPILLIAGIVWLIHRSAKPAQIAPI